MRLSVRWIFDHIVQKLDWQSFNISNLVKLLNKTTSEIEYVEHVKVDPTQFTLVTIIEKSNDQIKAYSEEFNQELLLPERSDVLRDYHYLVRKDQGSGSYGWASSADFGAEKYYLLPAIQHKASWKAELELEDYILILDNKAISHRPDLWGHRGFAREVAALLNYDLKPLDQLISSFPIEENGKSQGQTGPFTLAIKPSATAMCKRFAGLYIPEIKNGPSAISIAARLLRVGAKPIDFLVDATNYVMFDIGQPMHAYDAHKISSKNVVVQAGNGDALTLLDGTEVTLDARDCGIYESNGEVKPIGLAGIMGGLSTAVSNATTSLLLESANFNPDVIRHSSIRLKKRTEASARFEKSLDPNQNTAAILRFLNILDEYAIDYTSSNQITSLGALVPQNKVQLKAELIQKLLSIDLEPKLVTKILTKIGFEVAYKDYLYDIEVPTFRGTKDVTIPADIIEELGRFIGYEAIDLVLPTRVMKAFDFKSVQNVREIKKHLAYGLDMNEVQSYAFFDEEFLKELAYNPGQTVEVINPQSENWRRLVTSLVPNLLKVVATNKHKQDQFRYFELNRIWRFLSIHDTKENKKETNNQNALEALELSGIMGDQKGKIDFYEGKNILNSLFEFLHLNVKWRKPQITDLGTRALEPWYYSHETAELTFDNQVIGLAGMADPRFISGIVPEGKAFIFELDGNFLINSRPPFKKFSPLEKYPEVHIDISLLVPDYLTVHEIQDNIKKITVPGLGAKVTKVQLVDFFEKEEWGNKKSLTFRITLYDEDKTLIKAEIDQLYQQIVGKIEKMGGIIR